MLITYQSSIKGSFFLNSDQNDDVYFYDQTYFDRVSWPKVGHFPTLPPPSGTLLRWQGRKTRFIFVADLGKVFWLLTRMPVDISIRSQRDQHTVAISIFLPKTSV